MKKLLSCLAVAFSFVYSGAKVNSAELQVGDPAPEFKLKGSDGHTYDLNDFRGKQAVVLAWFPKAFTPGCTKECTSMGADGAEIQKFNVAYFTVSVDTAEDNASFAKSLEKDMKDENGKPRPIGYPILADPDRTAATAYGVIAGDKGFAKRWTFYIGKDGKILYIDKDASSKVATYGKVVAAKLAELKIETK